MKLKSGRLRYDLYLTPGIDDRLINHLQPFQDARRTNEELRRMLYSAMDGTVAVRPAPPRVEAPRRAEQTQAVELTGTPASDVKSNLKRFFGKPGAI